MLFCIRCKTLIGYLQNVVRILAKREISLRHQNVTHIGAHAPSSFHEECLRKLCLERMQEVSTPVARPHTYIDPCRGASIHTCRQQRVIG